MYGCFEQVHLATRRQGTPFFKLLKKEDKFQWTQEAQEAFEELKTVVSQNPPMGVDRQHESQEARSLYPSSLQLARALRLKFVGHAT
jgi:hypothetical protein